MFSTCKLTNSALELFDWTERIAKNAYGNITIVINVLKLIYLNVFNYGK